MKNICSIDKVFDLIQLIKERGKGYLTNFFIDIPKTQLWLDLNLMEYDEEGETVFICRKNSGFKNLFFISSGISVFSEDIDRFLKKNNDELFVIDLIGKNDTLINLKSLLTDNGFYSYTTLVRMSKTINDHFTVDKPNPYISYPDTDQVEEIIRLLNNYFDPYAEQLPLAVEINKWAANNQIVIFSDDNKTIQGFLIFQLNGLTSYLKYWFVSPDYRERKIGSSLIRHFLNESVDSHRQLFWVIESNANAIKRYEHYGFRKEELYDHILINKNISYE